MNANIKADAAITMSSREIADLLDCRHDNVKRTIETLQNKGLVTFTQTEEKGIGRPVTLFHVGKRDSYVIVAQLSPEFTARLVDRWQELEAAVAQPAIPTNFTEALRLVLQLEEERQALAETKARLLPYAQVGATVGQRNRLGVVEFARRLPGVDTQQVQKDLQVMQYLFKQNGNWAVYSKFRGVLFDEVFDNDGRSKVVALEKGQQLLVRLYHEGRLTMKADARH
ncbi:Rha family transcriptional regulator [Stutzerimonas stutzeri]